MITCMKLKCVSTATTDRDMSMSDGRVLANVEYTRLLELATSLQYWRKITQIFIQPSVLYKTNAFRIYFI